MYIIVDLTQLDFITFNHLHILSKFELQLDSL